MPSQNPAQFFGIAAHLMRQILVQHARRHQAAKRGGDITTIPFDEGLGIDQPAAVDLVALEEALTGLEACDPRRNRIVELRFYGGLSIEETAAVLGVSARTVKREWPLAKAWLYYELAQDNPLTTAEHQIDDLLQTAVPWDPDERAALLDRACAAAARPLSGFHPSSRFRTPESRYRLALSCAASG